MSPTRFLSVPNLVVGLVAILSFSANSAESPFPDEVVQPTELGATPLRLGRDYSILDLGNISSEMSGSQVEALLATFPTGTITSTFPSQAVTVNWSANTKSFSGLMEQSSRLTGADTRVRTWLRH